MDVEPVLRLASTSSLTRNSCQKDDGSKRSGSYRSFLFHRREIQIPKAPIKTKKIMNGAQRKKIFGVTHPSETIIKVCSGDSIPLLTNRMNIPHDDTRDDFETIATSSSSRSMDFGLYSSDRIRDEELNPSEKWIYTPKNKNPSDPIDFYDYSCETPITSHISSVKHSEVAHRMAGFPLTNVDMNRLNNYTGSPSSPKKIHKELLNILFVENSNSSQQTQTIQTNISIQENIRILPAKSIKIDKPDATNTKTIDTQSDGVKEPVSYSSSQIDKSEREQVLNELSGPGKTDNSILSYFSSATKRLHQTIMECCAPTMQSPPTVSHNNSFHRLMTRKYITQDYVTSSISVDEYSF